MSPQIFAQAVMAVLAAATGLGIMLTFLAILYKETLIKAFRVPDLCREAAIFSANPCTSTVGSQKTMMESSFFENGRSGGILAGREKKDGRDWTDGDAGADRREQNPSGRG